MELKGRIINIKNSVEKKVIKVRMLLFGEQRLEQIEKNFPTIKNTNETIDSIINKRASLVRFGDGELGFVMRSLYRIDFQNRSPKLSKRLREVLQSNDENILICLPPFNSQYNNSENVCLNYRFWQVYWFQYYNKLKKYFNNTIYYNAFISRLDVFMENDIDKIKKMWEDKDVVFVYGKNGRFNTESILFDNIKSISEIQIPAKDAFSEYDNILNECLKVDKNSLFIISAGPTATVLAYDLAKKGYQALDLGHLPNSYDQYLGKIRIPEAIPIVNN